MDKPVNFHPLLLSMGSNPFGSSFGEHEMTVLNLWASRIKRRRNVIVISHPIHLGREAMAEMKAVGKRHEKGTATIQDDEGRADDEEEDPKRAEAITHLEEEGYSKRIILQAILKHGLDDKDQRKSFCSSISC